MPLKTRCTMTWVDCGGVGGLTMGVGWGVGGKLLVVGCFGVATGLGAVGVAGGFGGWGAAGAKV